MSFEVFVSAGEPSGDLLAGELLEALRNELPEVRFFGICGERMKSAGCEAIFTIDQLSVMGFVEVLKHLSYLKRLETLLLQEIDRRKPRFAILVDYPGFHMRLADALKLRGIFVFQYVAPQLWAWGEKRTRTLKNVTDEVLGIMPFEEGFFREREVNYTYVGTPQVDRAAAASSDRSRFGLAAGETVIGFFPGSRRSEIQRLVPRMLAAREVLRRKDPSLRFVLSAAPSLPLSLFAEVLGQELPPPRIDAPGLRVFELGDTFLVQGQSIHLMKCASAAVVTSGTATLECALTHTPMTVAYVMNGLSFQMAKRFVKLTSISLVNLVAGQPLVREFIQDFTAEELADELLRLAREGSYRAQKTAELEGLSGRLRGDLARSAAHTIAACYREGLPRGRHLIALEKESAQRRQNK